MKRLFRHPLFVVIALIPLLASCAALQKAMKFSEVRFTFDHVSSVQVAGIDLMHVRSVDQINPFKVARATLAASRGSLPLELTVHVRTENPVVNAVAATLVAMEWTLMLDGRETVSGTINDRIDIPAGGAKTIPLKLRLNMASFFSDKRALDMLDLALAVAGEGGKVPKGVALKIRPTIQTPLGVMRYREMLIRPQENRS